MSMWPFEATALGWLGVAFVAAIVEVSVPHFGSMFVSLGAVAGAAAALLGYGLSVQFGAFIIVMVGSLAALRSRLIGRLGGPGVPSRTGPLIGRHGLVTTDIDPTIGTGRVTVGGEDWAARAATTLAVGTKIRVLKADGIVLEVTPI
jgi:membrane protein implicated in regulation of membrane protease activity